MINAQQEIATLPKGITPTIADVEASKIASSVIQHSSYIDSLNVTTNAVASYQKVISTALEPMHSYFASIAETVGNASIVMSNMLSAWTQSPFLNWLAGYDFSPILRALETVANFSITHEKIEKYKHHYLLPLYECHWFPYAGLYASFSLLDEIDEILETSRGKSKRRTARIDKAILSYYDDKRIHEIKQRCRKSTMESHVKKMVNQAINAHLRGEYVLTIACLATLWEGMLKQKMPAKTRSNKELKKDITGNYFIAFVIKIHRYQIHFISCITENASCILSASYIQLFSQLSISALPALFNSFSDTNSADLSTEPSSLDTVFPNPLPPDVAKSAIFFPAKS